MCLEEVQSKEVVGKFKGSWRKIPGESEVIGIFLHFLLMYFLTIVFRLIHGFTCAGILPTQYLHFSQFAGIGVVGKWYIQAGKWVSPITFVVIIT